MVQEKTLPRTPLQAGVSAAALRRDPFLQQDMSQQASPHLAIAASWVGNRRREIAPYPFYPQTAGSPF